MRYGLIGEHLGHSYSCRIHSEIADYNYELAELRPDEVPDFLKKREFNAINVTIPYKQTVIPYLDEISENALGIGAVNTVVNKNGRLYGYNTDLAGMLSLAGRIGIDAGGKKLLILGSGGTSKTAAAAAVKLGAGEIIKVSRTARGGISYAEAVEKHSDAAVIINTTPVGMFPNTDRQAIDLAPFGGLEAVLDVVYNPLRTDLVLDAHRRGVAAEGGLYMLAAQAVYASALFLGKEPDESVIEKVFTSVYNDKRNIVLTGMPTCGKTSVGKELARRTGKSFFDSDEIIVEKLGMPISEYFKSFGEASFRAVETAVIAELSKKSGCIIATGGGAVLDERNVTALKRNGTVFFLDRSPEKLIASNDRPLSSSRDELMKRYNERYELYKASADVTLDADGTVAKAAADILKA